MWYTWPKWNYGFNFSLACTHVYLQELYNVHFPLWFIIPELKHYHFSYIQPKILMLFIKIIASNINILTIIRFYINSVLPFSTYQPNLFCFSKSLTVIPDLWSLGMVDYIYALSSSWAFRSKVAVSFPVADRNILGLVTKYSNPRLWSWVLICSRGNNLLF